MSRLPKGCRAAGGIRAEALAGARDAFLDVFRASGYQLFWPSGLQLLEEVWDRVAPTFRKRLLAFSSPGGEICCLRGDLTLAAVSHLASHHEPHERPLRLCYADRVYRLPEHAGETLEHFQVGAELLGWEGPGADAEMVALLFEALERMGAHGCTVVFGNVTLVERVLDGLPAALGRALEQALRRQDLTTYRRLLETPGLPPERRPLLQAFPHLKGTTEILEEALGLGCPEEPLVPLRDLASTLETLGHGSSLRFDLALSRDLGYYSGPVFEVYAPEGGRPLGGGGRYDGLLSSHGLLGQALGLALDLDLLAEVPVGGRGTLPEIVIWGGTAIPAQALATASALRARGWGVELSWNRDATASRSRARRQRCRWWVDATGDTVTTLRSSRTETLASWLEAHRTPEGSGERAPGTIPEEESPC